MSGGKAADERDALSTHTEPEGARTTSPGASVVDAAIRAAPTDPDGHVADALLEGLRHDKVPNIAPREAKESTGGDAEAYYAGPRAPHARFPTPTPEPAVEVAITPLPRRSPPRGDSVEAPTAVESTQQRLRSVRWVIVAATAALLTLGALLLTSREALDASTGPYASERPRTSVASAMVTVTATTPAASSIATAASPVASPVGSSGAATQAPSQTASSRSAPRSVVSVRIATTSTASARVVAPPAGSFEEPDRTFRP